MANEDRWSKGRIIYKIYGSPKKAFMNKKYSCHKINLKLN